MSLRHQSRSDAKFTFELVVKKEHRIIESQTNMARSPKEILLVQEESDIT